MNISKRIVMFLVFVMMFTFVSLDDSKAFEYEEELNLLPRTSKEVQNSPSEVFLGESIYKDILEEIKLKEDLEKDLIKLSERIDVKTSAAKEQKDKIKKLDSKIKKQDKKMKSIDKELKEVEKEIKEKEEILHPFIRPIVESGRITSEFGLRNHPISGKKKLHTGIDIAKSGKVDIVSIADGVVTKSYRSKSLGEVIFAKYAIDGQTYEAVYAHMRTGSRQFKTGDKIKQGDKLGLMGTTGNSTGQHLHFELNQGYWIIGGKNAFDPRKMVDF